MAGDADEARISVFLHFIVVYTLWFCPEKKIISRLRLLAIRSGRKRTKPLSDFFFFQSQTLQRIRVKVADEKFRTFTKAKATILVRTFIVLVRRRNASVKG